MFYMDISDLKTQKKTKALAFCAFYTVAHSLFSS